MKGAPNVRHTMYLESSTGSVSPSLAVRMNTMCSRAVSPSRFRSDTSTCRDSNNMMPRANYKKARLQSPSLVVDPGIVPCLEFSAVSTGE